MNADGAIAPVVRGAKSQVWFGLVDVPAAANPNPKPVDFRAEQVKESGDGELFYSITHGIEGSAMEARGFFDEERRWHLVSCPHKEGLARS